MDPSKFSVRVKNPSMTRQERFGDSPCPNNIREKTSEYEAPIGYDKYETNVASWCAPRKIYAIESEASSNEDDPDGELRVRKSSKNLKNLVKNRVSQHARRIDELSQPKFVVNRLQGTRENYSRICPSRRQNKPEITRTSSQSDFTAIQPRIITEKPILRHRRPTDRIAKLAEPKIRERVAVNPPGKVEERALLAVASKRIAELATPKYGPSRVAPSEKANPYAVSPRALRATCSPAIDQLARPKKFRSAFSNSKVNRRSSIDARLP